ncbi:MAG: cytochrome c [Deltaproteobacteria bacterium]|nr:cytochrome c [Deltaproteobacteria bacterium]
MRWALLLVLFACGSTPPSGPLGEPHLEQEWFLFRAQDLGVSLEEAQTRDRALSESEPPQLDATTQREAAALWRSLCAGCHGATGRLEGVPVVEPAPKKWGGFGVSMGFFFGGDKMRAGLYRKIREGGEKMPAWGELLSREQTWALVAHLEGL